MTNFICKSHSKRKSFDDSLVKDETLVTPKKLEETGEENFSCTIE